ncbi:MAG: hypothetical protein AB1689_00575, partial [Thermodesulfobacteriota bacterium]
MRRAWLIGAAVLAGALAAAGLVHRLAADERIAFLWPWAPAGWIVAPAPLELRAKRQDPVAASFARDLELAAAPPTARLRVRAFRRAEVRVNGAVALLAPGPGGWKSAAEADVAVLLHAGTNGIEARVENAHGPPALWLALELPAATLVSNESWRVVRAGGSETAAASATGAPRRPAFASAAALPRLPDVARALLPELALLALLGVLLTLAGMGLARRIDATGSPRRTRATEAALWLAFATVAGAWLVRDLAASRALPLTTGFDAEGHLEYVEHVRVTGTLPLADQGWQAYHPPLYYVLQAAALSATGASALDAAASVPVRAVHATLGVGFLLAVASALRSLCAASPRKRLFGLIFAGFLPVLLYVFQFPGNEALAIALGAWSFYACLRVVDGTTSGVARDLLLGLALGAALLAKQSALLLVPPMLAVVAWSAVQRGSLRRAATSVAVVLTSLLVVCGWHYARVAARFGDPFVVNWDGTAGPAWWQDPGFRTPYDFLRISGALLAPHFAASDGLVAGLYSSLWSDSFVAGVARLEAAPPWRHDLLVLGPLLGVPLTVALAVGFFVTIADAL